MVDIAERWHRLVLAGKGRSFWQRVRDVFFCEHEYWFVRSIYGDEINSVNGRSWWKCVKCGKWQCRRDIYGHLDKTSPCPSTGNAIYFDDVAYQRWLESHNG